ncbi:LLM class flavin-dependent oxidoreductase [Nonomuraea thailandensis]
MRRSSPTGALPARKEPAPWNSASCPCPICKTDPAAGTLHDPARRTREIVSYAIAADQAGLDAFTLFGIDPADYDEVFAEKLDLLLAIRDSEYVTWSGRHRPALNHLPVPSRPQQARLPLWLGGKASRDARADLFPFYREYLRPKTPGGRGWLVSAEQYQALSGPFGALMTGSPRKSSPRSSPNANCSASTASWDKSTSAACRRPWWATPSNCWPPRSRPPSARNSACRQDRPDRSHRRPIPTATPTVAAAAG